MAIASNYLKYPEALARQLVLDLAPSVVGHAVKVARHRVKRCWAGIKEIGRKVWASAVKLAVRLDLSALFHNVT